MRFYLSFFYDCPLEATVKMSHCSKPLSDPAQSPPLRSCHWSVLAGNTAPRVKFPVTVCGRVPPDREASFLLRMDPRLVSRVPRVQACSCPSAQPALAPSLSPDTHSSGTLHPRLPIFSCQISGGFFVFLCWLWLSHQQRVYGTLPKRCIQYGSVPGSPLSPRPSLRDGILHVDNFPIHTCTQLLS